MVKIKALKDGVQIQLVEYADQEHGLAEMIKMYPDCEILTVSEQITNENTEWETDYGSNFN